jgi:sulfur-oxidizing protein SoxX
MKKLLIVAAAAAVTALPLNAESIAPTNVAFSDGAVSGSLSGVAGDPAEGRILMNKGSGNCIACHAVSELDDLPFHGEIGPSLDGVADRWTEAELRGIIANAKEMFPETMMPSFYRTSGFVRPGNAYTGKAAEGELDPLLTAQQVEDVVAYLKTLTE